MSKHLKLELLLIDEEGIAWLEDSAGGTYDLPTVYEADGRNFTIINDELIESFVVKSVDETVLGSHVKRHESTCFYFINSSLMALVVDTSPAENGLEIQRVYITKVQRAEPTQ